MYSPGCKAAFEGPGLVQMVRHFLEPPVIQNSDSSILDPDDTAALPFPKAFIDPLSRRSNEIAKFALRYSDNGEKTSGSGIRLLVDYSKERLCKSSWQLKHRYFRNTFIRQAHSLAKNLDQSKAGFRIFFQKIQGIPSLKDSKITRGGGPGISRTLFPVQHRNLSEYFTLLENCEQNFSTIRRG